VANGSNFRKVPYFPVTKFFPKNWYLIFPLQIYLLKYHLFLLKFRLKLENQCRYIHTHTFIFVFFWKITVQFLFATPGKNYIGLSLRKRDIMISAHTAELLYFKETLIFGYKIAYWNRRVPQNKILCISIKWAIKDQSFECR